MKPAREKAKEYAGKLFYVPAHKPCEHPICFLSTTGPHIHSDPETDVTVYMRAEGLFTEAITEARREAFGEVLQRYSTPYAQADCLTESFSMWLERMSVVVK